MKPFFIACLAACAALFCSVTAFAADAYVVDVQPTVLLGIGYIFAALSGLVSGLLVYLFDPAGGKLKKLQIDATIRTYLETALHAGLNYAENKARAAAQDLKNPTVNEKIISDALGYVLKRVPDALNHFGIDETDLRDLIIARFVPDGGSIIHASNPS